MIQIHKVGNRLNVRINRFVKKVITPVVLLGGLLLLMLFHFRGVLQETRAQDDLYRGTRSFSAGALQYTFQQNAGADRPGVTADNAPVLSWVEWSSTIGVDGNIANLWDNFHGYDYDSARRQVFSTISGTGWQVIQIVTLVNAHTMTVDYQLAARPRGLAVPHHIELTIAHFHQALYQPAIQGNILTTQILPGNVQNFSSKLIPHALGVITLKVSGPQAPASAIALDDLHGNVTATGVQQILATSFTTRYVMDNPVANKLTPLGSETLTFTRALPISTPVPATVPTPTP